MLKHRVAAWSVVGACAVALSGCGGGGGSGPTPVPPASTLLAIDGTNYQAVGQATVSTAMYLGDTGGMLTGAQSSSDPKLLNHAVSVARRALASASSRPVVLGGAEVRDTVACSQGGSLAITTNDANNNGKFDVGDSLTLDAQSCKEDGSVMQGRMALSVQTLTGVYDSNNFNATLSMTLTAFSVTTGASTAQGDGTLTLSISETPAGGGEVTLATSRLVLGGRVAGQNISATLTDTRLSVRVETINGAVRTTTTYGGSLASSLFGNKQVTISTPQPLVSTGADLYPSSGQLLVRGDAGSVLRITAVNAAQVRLEVDAGGDGTYETSVLKTWAELQ